MLFDAIRRDFRTGGMRKDGPLGLFLFLEGLRTLLGYLGTCNSGLLSDSVDTPTPSSSGVGGSMSAELSFGNSVSWWFEIVVLSSFVSAGA